MTLQELYVRIGGNYESALKIMRRERLIDRSVKRIATSTLCDDLMDAGAAMDGTRIFEAAHALKGVSANLGLNDFSAQVGDICDEFRAGNERRYTDEEVAEKLAAVEANFQQIVAGINEYAASQE